MGGPPAAQRLPIAFQQPSDARTFMVRRQLDTLGFAQPRLVATILSDLTHPDQQLRFTYGLKTDPVKAT